MCLFYASYLALYLNTLHLQSMVIDGHLEEPMGTYPLQSKCYLYALCYVNFHRSLFHLYVYFGPLEGFCLFETDFFLWKERQSSANVATSVFFRCWQICCVYGVKKLVPTYSLEVRQSGLHKFMYPAISDRNVYLAGTM